MRVAIACVLLACGHRSGLGAILPATKLTATVTIDTVTSTDVVTLPVTLVESGLAIVGANAIDMAGGSPFTMQLPTLRGRGQTVLGADGYLYATVAVGGHRDSEVAIIAVAKLDPVTMTTVGTATVTSATTGKAHACALHGTMLAAGIGPNVYLLNTSTMSFIDTDTSTADVIDPVANVTAGGPVAHLVFSPDGATIYATESQSSQIFSIDPVGFTAAEYHLASGRVLGLAIDAAGTLWWG